MKARKQQPQAKNTRFEANKRPEIRDDLDSREGEEQIVKGDDVTHNVKDRHNKPRKGKR
jgi:hypothetical protein